MKMKILLAVVAVLMTTQSASASLLMILNDTSTSGLDVVVLDETGSGVLSASGAYTSNAVENAGSAGVADFMQFSGTVGGFTVVATTGTSFENGLTLDSVSISGATGGSVDVILIDTDFVDNGYSFLTNFNVLAGGVGTAFGQSVADSANGEGFEGGSSIIWAGDFLEGESLAAGDVYSNYSPNVVAGSSAYSMGLAVRVTHSGAGQTQFSSSLAQVPEPGTLAIWSSLALGVCAFRRRKRA